MLKHIAILLASASVSVAASAQRPEFVEIANRVTAEEPAPALQEVAPRALAMLQERAQAISGCRPTGVTIDQPQSALFTITVMQRLAAQQARNGWMATAHPEGCDGAQPARFLVMRLPDRTLHVQFAGIGEGIAIPLQQDLFVGAGSAAFVALSDGRSDCGVDTIRFDSTRIASRSDDLGPDFHGARFAGSWQEAWTFSGCSRRVEVPIAFTALGDGDMPWSIDTRAMRVLD